MEDPLLEVHKETGLCAFCFLLAHRIGQLLLSCAAHDHRSSLYEAAGFELSYHALIFAKLEAMDGFAGTGAW